ncbi:MAG: SPASM domain-containing protein [Candidatus Coatesbacteria bacterium]|nr:SPASM domain-containing protein [Candidatus Coatesbacteria bacterium]
MTSKAIPDIDASNRGGRFASVQFMLMTSMSCPARCEYCFGPRVGPNMSSESLDLAIDFIDRVVSETGQRSVSVTFHGGEPLMAGYDLLRNALEGLSSRFGRERCILALQSNLWLLDERLCALFSEYEVEIGTSLDGAHGITDAHRGAGHFAKTMQGVDLARKKGLKLGCVATLLPDSASHLLETLDFFREQRLPVSFRPLAPVSSAGGVSNLITPDDYANLVLDMLDYYLDHRGEMVIHSLDELCRSVAFSESELCTFRDCLGMFLVIDPYGEIYPCQRFCGFPECSLGRLGDRPVLSDLLSSPMPTWMARREAQIDVECGDCPHISHCRGGCAYSAWASPDGPKAKDPYCSAYRAIFSEIRKRLVSEMRSEENLAAIATEPPQKGSHPLLRRGPISEILHLSSHRIGRY